MSAEQPSAEQASAERDLLDRAGITDALVAYSQGLDQRSWEIFHRAFTADAALHYPGIRAEPFTPAELQAHFTGRNDGTRLSGQHNLANVHITVDGDTAHSVTEFSFITPQRSHEPGVLYEVSGGGLYVDDLVRTPDGWRITAREVASKNRSTRHVPCPAATVEAIAGTLRSDWY